MLRLLLDPRLIANSGVKLPAARVLDAAAGARARGARSWGVPAWGARARGALAWGAPVRGALAWGVQAWGPQAQEALAWEPRRGEPGRGECVCLRSVSPAVVGTGPGQARLFPLAGQMLPTCCSSPAGRRVGNAGSAAGSGSAAAPARLVPVPRLHLQMVPRKPRKRKQTFICTLGRVSPCDLTLLRWKSQAVPSSSEKTVLANALKRHKLLNWAQNP